MRLFAAVLLSLMSACLVTAEDPLERGDDPAEVAARDQAIDLEADLELLADELENQAGCDGIQGQSCTPRGACCDVHDDCIDTHCGPGYGDIFSCTADDVAAGRCTAACRACHAAVRGCFWTCTGFNLPATCQPSACCGPPNVCGQEQACYDRSVDPPVLITDPCECEARGIDLSPSPPRPEGHCCAATGWGCCAGVGEAPGSGGGQCCAGLIPRCGGCIPDDEWFLTRALHTAIEVCPVPVPAESIDTAAAW